LAPQIKLFAIPIASTPAVFRYLKVIKMIAFSNEMLIFNEFNHALQAQVLKK